VFATTAPAYASEVTPLAGRGCLAVYNNWCFAIGQLIVNGVPQGPGNNLMQWSYRMPFALQWIWPIPLILILSFGVKLPWFVVKSECYAEAKKVLRRLADKSDEEIHATISQMTYTIELEDKLNAGTSYIDCFKGVKLRPTEIAFVAWAGQVSRELH
jgi:SP family general alpha glucoside:H+ symporter-like MFS transporter